MSRGAARPAHALPECLIPNTNPRVLTTGLWLDGAALRRGAAGNDCCYRALYRMFEVGREDRIVGNNMYIWFVFYYYYHSCIVV
ncbi:hypothetical protein HBH64_152530 [Parastagonospora nodorum]|nr:hypothetical protein HBI01_027890 [Parastagonospora nodorum]KAH4315185.1 hypothetical protein HBI02_052380 [Parastagonospora nodorum]KAH4338446.1 hypothetical protein HBI00_004780 [Parastagonospora nodorum]KAH4386483.1 hypothetical protein HBH94_040870 [Parastagonospora nodorum]KAH4470937.1 hypothetical protein HBH90_061750 [Parastagonospora nodorum]